jgi:hypothetical protein
MRFRLFVRYEKGGEDVEQELPCGWLPDSLADALKRMKNGEIFAISEWRGKLVYYARVADRKIVDEYDPARVRGAKRKPKS